MTGVTEADAGIGGAMGSASSSVDAIPSGTAGGTSGPSGGPSGGGEGGTQSLGPEPNGGEPEPARVEPSMEPSGGSAGASNGGTGAGGAGGSSGGDAGSAAGGSVAGAGGSAPSVSCEDGMVPAAEDGCAPGNDANCNGVPNEDCECVDGDERSCALGGYEGTCAEAGVQVCLGERWGACTVEAAASDSCEPGNDDNCNGTPNDDCACIDGTTRPCSEGGLHGKCADGEQECSNGAWGDCDIQPSAADTCDPGNDDDCDGRKNEDCACTEGDTRPCSDGGLFGPCATGTQTCGATGAWGPCSLAPASYDTCAAGNDANCNGMANSPLSPSCECVEGAAQCVAATPSTQRQVCSSSGTWGTPTNCPFVCTGNGVCAGSCAPGDRDCNGNTPRQCNDSGSWVAETACNATTPCQGEGVCQSCPTGYYASNGACVPWTTCNPGQFVQTQGTPTANRVCSNCPTGYFSTTTNATSCTPWTNCNDAGGVQTTAGSAIADRVCTPFPSCNGLTNNCGAAADESCCNTQPVTGESGYYRGGDFYYPATTSSFRLDKFEVTVGRFRKFKAAWDGGWRPAAGSGKHTHVHNGNGLEFIDSYMVSTYEPGWDTTWESEVDTSNAARGSGDYVTWTSTAGSNETKPINFVNYYEAYAFCIWDGGFLPSEAEWNLAQQGGKDYTKYPWGDTDPGANANLAIYGCYYGGGGGTCTGVTNIGNVGAVPAGNSKYGQANLIGNVSEWVFDTKPGVVEDCVDCGNWLGGYATYWGSDYEDPLDRLEDTFGQILPPHYRNAGIGFRCARTP